MPKTLLLADDSVTIQKVVGISFANEDVVLLTVDNGDDAVLRAREARPDLVLADVMMPGKDGYEVCEILKADPELRHVPVLLLSGTFEPFDEERARRAGADGHVTKPFEAQALVDQVNALLARAPEPTLGRGAPAGDATVALAAEAAEEAFDFFEDEMARTAPSPTAPAARLLAEADDDAEPLELVAAVDAEPASRRAAAVTDAWLDEPGDAQATVLFADEIEPSAATRRAVEPPPFPGDGFAPEALERAVPGGAPPAPGPAGAAPTGFEESFDFGFEEAAPAEPLAAVAPPAPPPPVEPAAPLFDDEGEEPDEGPGEAWSPPAALAAPAPPPVPTAGGPALVPPPVPELSPPPFPEAALPAPPAAAGAPVAIPVSGPGALSEPVQKQIQETLEKVVWEAFGDLSERIVRDVIERVEAVAWEVIPQMAEALIREEIRRLQDGGDEP
jgi:CheY-like chemotaxis protein